MSKYTKKELCAKINELYRVNDKPISYSTFSNNVKNGTLSSNELIAVATLVEEINLNKIVLLYKNEMLKERKEVPENIVSKYL